MNAILYYPWNALNWLVGWLLTLGCPRIGELARPEAARHRGPWLHEARGPLWFIWKERFGAITLGNRILLAREALAADARLLKHEARHIEQQKQWGPFFFPAYALSSVWAFLSGKHYYTDNAFEADAVRHEVDL